MKKIVSLVTAAALAMSISCAAAEIGVTIAGQPLEFGVAPFDVAPVMESDRVLVPMRAIFEKLGANVSWDEDTSTAIAVKGEKVVIIQIDNTTAFVNSEAKTLDVPARLILDRTMVPIRFVSEALDCDVAWDEASNTVIVEPNTVEIELPDEPDVG